MAIFTKGLIGAGLAGTIALGTLVTWNGAETIDLAKTKITEAGQQIGVFKSNETKLVGKVNLLKTEKATLTARVADLEAELAAEKAKNTTDNQRILDLEAEIETLNAQITELETEIATLNTDLENAAGNTDDTVARINALEAELNAANTQAEELQYTLDETVLAEPDQVAVDAALSSEPGESAPIDPPVYDVAVKMIADSPFTLSGTFNKVTFDINTDGNVTVTNLHSFIVTVDGIAVGGTNGANVVIGTPEALDKKVVIVSDPYGQSTKVYLTNE